MRDVVIRPMHPEDVPAPRRSPPSANADAERYDAADGEPRPSAARRPAGPANWILRTNAPARARPRRVLGGRARRGAWSGSSCRSGATCSGSWRRTPCDRASRDGHRPTAARRGAVLLPWLPARHVRVQLGPEGLPPLPAGRLLAAPGDDLAGEVDRSRDPGGRARPRGHRVRLRPDGLDGPAAPRRRARAGPPAAGLDCTGCSSPTTAPARATSTSTPTAARACSAATNRRTAAAAALGGARRGPAGAAVAIGHVTPANEWAVDVGLEARLVGVACRATSRCAACARRRPTCTTQLAALSP